MTKERKKYTPVEKANILIEAFPYIKRFYGKTIVIKFGGSAMINESLKKSFALDIILMKYIGIAPVIVHGGGPKITEVMKKMGKEPNFIEGQRITDSETMDIVEMVLGGIVNKQIVALINHHGGRAVGLTGKDGQFIKAKKLNFKRLSEETGTPEIIDIGMVGEVESINPEIVKILKEGDFIPVIAPIGIGEHGETYNINADHVASRVASALHAEKLILLTDEVGIIGKDKSLLPTLNSKEVNNLIQKKVIKGGMLPKVAACLDALDSHVSKTHIIDGRVNHAILLEMFTDEGVGTEIVN
ncbi:MAG TPA: acetylglutamate kinase [Nitrospinota bacterium]|nr:acetylglutamate kinase [Nitrospinota bacterium]